MSQQPPGGGWPPQPPQDGPPPGPPPAPQPDSPTVPNWQPNYQAPPPPQPTAGYPPPPTGGYPPPPPGSYPPQPGSGYPPPPPGGYPPQSQPGYYQNAYQPPPPPPDNHTTRNIVVGVVVALVLILIVAAAYAATRPQPSFPIVVPSASPSAEPTKTPKPSKPPVTEAPATETPPSEAPTTAQPPTQEPATEAPPSGQPPTEAPATAAPTNTAPSPGASTIPGVEDQDIVIGDPVVIGGPSFPQVALMTQNLSNLVKSYSLTGTFKNGDTITATATGYVSDHLPGTIRTPTLFIDGTPGAGDTLTVTIDAMLSEDPSTPEGDVAKAMSFGPPSIVTGDIPSIDVEVTNGSPSTATFSVSAGVLRDGVLVGVGSGFVNDLSPDQTKTATLYVTGDVAATDQLILSIDSVIIQ